jgi:hypothetical protein
MGSAGGDCWVPRFLWDWRGPQEIYSKNGESYQRQPVIQALQLTALFVGGVTWQQKQPNTSLCVCGFNWIHISSLAKTCLWNQATVMRFCYVRYCNLLEVRDYWRNKSEGVHNRSENGRGARVALYSYTENTENPQSSCLVPTAADRFHSRC